MKAAFRKWEEATSITKSGRGGDCIVVPLSAALEATRG